MTNLRVNVPAVSRGDYTASTVRKRRSCRFSLHVETVVMTRQSGFVEHCRAADVKENV